MRVIIDRFEGEFAVVELEDGKTVEIPRILVRDAKEGDVLDITVNKEETEKRKSEVESLLDKLFQ